MWGVENLPQESQACWSAVPIPTIPHTLCRPSASPLPACERPVPPALPLLLCSALALCAFARVPALCDSRGGVSHHRGSPACLD